MKKIALCGILAAVAMALSYIERLFPIELIVPVPGVKLGLANIVTLFALFYLGFNYAVSVIVVRCLLTALLFGSFTSFWFSLSGAVLSLLVMYALKPLYNRSLTILGISVSGAAAHNIGQLIAAAVILKSTGVFAYLSVLLIIAIVTGGLTGFAAGSIFVYFDKTDALYKLN